MKIGIVDDERPARSELIYLLSQKMPEAEFREANSSAKMLELLESEQLDAVFIDIHLGDMNGTTLSSLILEKQPQVAMVFATAYEEYAVRAYELGAVDYLLKPYSLDRIEKCLKKVQGYLRSQEQHDTRDVAGSAGTLEANQNKIILASGSSIRIVEIDTIRYIESYNRGCRIHTQDEVFYQNQTLNYYDEKLKSHNFYRVHKSFLVNLQYIMELIPSYNNGYACKLSESEDEVIPVGRHQYKEIREYFEI